MLSEETLRTLLFLTARAAALFFLGAFTGEALSKLRPAPATRWLAARRRAFTLAFATSHTIHLGFIITLATTYTEHFVREANPVILVLGGVVYLLIFALAATELARMSPRISVARFQTFAHIVIGGALARPLIVRAFEGRSPAFYVPAGLAFVVAFSLRAAAALRKADRTCEPLVPELELHR